MWGCKYWNMVFQKVNWYPKRVKYSSIDRYPVTWKNRGRQGHFISKTFDWICRKSERRICTLSKVENVNPLLLKYINRLSDVLYAIARFNESELIYIKY